METEFIKLALSQGIWAAVSVLLILYILRTQEKRDVKQDEREKSYQNIISTLTEKLVLIENVKKEVEAIKNIILKTK